MGGLQPQSQVEGEVLLHREGVEGPPRVSPLGLGARADLSQSVLQESLCQRLPDQRASCKCWLPALHPALRLR